MTSVDELCDGTVVADGKYTVLCRVGAGGTATVYRATGRDGRAVALKVLLADKAKYPVEVQRLRNEMSIGKALSDIHGVTGPLEFGLLPELGDRPYLVFEYLLGEELDYMLMGGRGLPHLQAVRIVRDVADILVQIHERGVVHRDIKPSNLMVQKSEDGIERVTVLDFGYACSKGTGAVPATARLTQVTERVGTKHYMAPEQVLGAPPSESWDVYALAITLYEAVVGTCPLVELSGKESMHRRCMPGAPSISIAGVIPGIPRALEEVVDRGLEFRVEDRIPSAAAFRDELDALLLVLACDPPKTSPRLPISALAVSRPSMPGVGQTVGAGRYDILHELGTGGTATVFAARDTQLGCTVALKLLIERYKGRPERECIMFDEAKALLKIGEHPHVVGLLDHGVLEDCSDWPFIALELVKGPSLHELARFERVHPRRVASIAMQLADALRESHRRGAIHRDVTATNVLIDQDADNRVVLIDFSHSVDAMAPKLPLGHPDRRTQEGAVPGTEQAMSPEQARAEPATFAMDVYAFGILLFELLTGGQAFPGGFGDCGRAIFIDTQAREGYDEPRIDRDEFSDIPGGLVDLVHDCVRNDPLQRPSMTDVMTRLESILSGMAIPSPVRMTEFACPVFSDAESDVPVSKGAPASTPHVYASKWGWVLGLTVMSALAVAAVFLFGDLNSGFAPAPVEDASASQLSSSSLSGSHLAAAKTTDLGGTHSVPVVKPGFPSAVVPPLPVRAPEKHPVEALKPVSPVVRPKHYSGRKKAKVAPPPSKVKVAPLDPVRCVALRGKAVRAYKEGDWRAVVSATKSTACWSDHGKQERVQLRITALWNLKLYEECARMDSRARRSKEKKLVSMCRERFEKSL